MSNPHNRRTNEITVEQVREISSGECIGVVRERLRCDGGEGGLRVVGVRQVIWWSLHIIT